MLPREEAYNAAISAVSNAPMSLDGVVQLWNATIEDRIASLFSATYSDLNFPPSQIARIALIDRQNYRASLTDDSFGRQLEEIHARSVAAAVAQLEFERDNPEKQDSKAPEPEEPGPEEPKPEEPKPEEPKPETDLGKEIGRAIGEFAFERVKWLGERLASNIEGAARESGEVEKAVRIVVGISVSDIEKYGILGGENSYLRKICPQWTGNEGVLGGENSFFRKNLGITW